MAFERYIKELRSNGYLPKEQLRRYNSALKKDNSEMGRVMGLSYGTVNVLRSYKSVNQRFRVEHAKDIKKVFSQKVGIVEMMREDHKSRGFMIAYDSVSWGLRVGVAKNYEVLEDYNAHLDMYLADTTVSLLINFAEKVHVVSVSEIAAHYGITPEEVMSSLEEPVKDDW